MAGLVLAAAACRPEGHGSMEIRHSEFFETHSGAGPQYDMPYNPSTGSHRVSITAGDRFSEHPGPDGRYHFDLFMKFEGLASGSTFGDPWTCNRIQDKHIRCVSDQEASGQLQGPSRYTLDFNDDRIASLTIEELGPPWVDRARVEDGFIPASNWPRVIARFRDDHYEWGDSAYEPPRSTAPPQVTDHDSNPIVLTPGAAHGPTHVTPGM
ncbi:MAG TPA: hypothetical protein VL588_10590 [Bdellovibrionota bacterium]|nr:hypothetical protein [Bdellovibrionota bacterium]